MINKKLIKMSKKELYKELQSASKELSDTIFDVRCGKDKDYSQVKQMKKKVAQLYTLIKNSDISKDKKVEKSKKGDLKQKKEVKKKNEVKKSEIGNKSNKNKLRKNNKNDKKKKTK
jgi:ribosomal protein L29